MALQEYHKIDLTTGVRLDVCLFDNEVEDRDGTVTTLPIPEDYKLGWGEGFNNPIWDFKLDTWVEGTPLTEIINPIRELKMKQLNEECQTAIKQGFEYEGDVFGFSDIDQTNFNQQLSLLLLDPTIDKVLWKTENNGVKYFTREQFIETCKAGEVHKRNNIGHYWQLKNHVMTYDFTDVNSLTSIDFSFTVPVGE